MTFQDLLALYENARRYDTARPVYDWPQDREALWYSLKDAELWAAAAGDLVADIKAQLAGLIDENESVRFGDFVYRMSPDRKERIPDPRALIEWLRDDWHHVVPLTASTSLRSGGLRAVAERRGVDYETVRDTFIEVEWGEKKLKAIPIDKAPKYTQKLEHGESTYGGKRG